ncbi:MAG: hypothetical protein A2498_00620 [Lentisphaerae bacterium RIFOXYC12_FULL_60_16]|nr:MAG: hypothetical protein A2498_00620 [Lentisphaerae bacterium RIFOXYC12_FULL_60_16]OGV84360.1 MAG: hypothetical protein A2340_03830 [Lentisphaerae bacterium RIFOXYB12_FULL_60_10]
MDKLSAKWLTMDPTQLPWQAHLLGLLIALLFVTGLIFNIILIVRRKEWISILAHRLRRIRKRPFLPMDASRMLLMLAILVLFINTLFLRLAAAHSTVHPLSLLLGQLAIPAVALAGLYGIMKERKASLRKAFGIHPARCVYDTGVAVGLLIAMFPVLIVASVICMSLLQAIGYPVNPQDVVQFLLDPAIPAWRQIFIMGLAIVAAPLVEEAVFRGVCLPAALKAMGTREAVVLIAVFFAFIHQHPESAVSLFLFALYLTAGYVWTGSLLTAIMMHALFNGSTLVALRLMQAAQ